MICHQPLDGFLVIDVQCCGAMHRIEAWKQMQACVMAGIFSVKKTVDVLLFRTCQSVNICTRFF